MKSTVKALIGRGLSTSLAEELQGRGLTLAKLKRQSSEKLSELGVPNECHAAIRNGSRPSIPDAVLFELLYSCKNTCCVCHNRNHGVIIHHIIPWSECRSHDERNLVVLCPNCHDRAHTTRDLTRDLSPEQLRHHKAAWLKEVRESNTRVLFSKRPNTFTDGVWDVFNRQRLLDCANSQGIDHSALSGASVIQESETEHNGKHFRWEGRLRMGENNEYAFYSHLLRRIADEYDWIDLRRIWTKSEFNSLLKANTLFALTAHYKFRPDSEADRGPGQTRRVYYQKKKLRVEFSFDAWECTTNSAHTCHLLGAWTCTALGFVRSLEDIDGCRVVRATCLAIGTGFSDYEGEIPEIALIAEARREAESDAE